MLMMVLLLLSAGGALAVADATGGDSATFLSADVVSAEDLEPLIAESEPVDFQASPDSAAAVELPHDNLSRSEAKELLDQVFGDELEAPAAILDEFDVKAFRSDHVAVVEPENQGEAPALISSLIPMRTDDGSGGKEEVDLNLNPTGDHLEPVNPLVAVEVPTELADGFAFPNIGVSIDVGTGDGDRTASSSGEDSVFFPNVRTDTDIVMSATPTGVETFTQLRTPGAPRDESFDLSIPEGARLEAFGEGARVLNAGGEVILSVSPPWAIDAEGSQVPTNLKIDGHSISISVSPPADAVFPILLDPLFESYNWSTGAYGGESDWTREEKPGFLTEMKVWDHWGMSVRSVEGSTSPGNGGWFNYYVPRYLEDTKAGLPEPTSYIKDIKLWNLYFLVNEGAFPPFSSDPFMQLGLWSPKKQQFTCYGSYNGAQGSVNDPNHVYDLCNPDQVRDVKRGGFGLGTVNSSLGLRRDVMVAQALVEVTDPEAPTLEFLGGMTQWANSSPSAPIKYNATDPGLGVYQVRLGYPVAAGGKGEAVTSLGCTGASANACPLAANQSSKAISYNPQSIAQGEYFSPVTVVDPLGQSVVSSTQLKIDHTAPVLSLTGNLTEQATAGINLREYTLGYTASDGDDATAAATTPAGSAGKGPGQLERPMGVATAPDGSVYTVDRLNNKVVKFDKEGKFALQFGSTGAADGQFNDPRGIDIAPDGTVWVADMGNDRVQAFSPTGAFLRKVKFSESTSEPYAVASGPGGVLWVTDIGLHRLIKLSESSLATLLITNGREGGGGGPAKGTAVIAPTGVATDKFGNVWIADGGLGKVLELDSAGKPLFEFGTAGSGDGQINGIVGIDISPAGNIAITERNNFRVQIFKPDGSYLRKFGAGTSGSANNQLFEPGGLSFGPDNTLAVADAGNKRVARWTHGDQDPQSGAAKVVVRVDGVAASTKEPGCATKNCQVSGSWTLDADDYAGGAHKVEVTATDAVGISATKTIDIQTHGDHTDPTIALSGTMTQQASIGTTRPTYKLKAEATDPGPTEELKSGVVMTSISVDGKVVDMSWPGCPAGGCSITREWTLNSSSYPVGSHTVEVKATDAVGRVSTKTLTINIARDTTAPEISYFGPFYSAPSGWLEQKKVGYTAFASDYSGYGVTSVELKIDGAAVNTFSQTCTDGGCSKLFGLSETLDMAEYSGGAHPVEFIARDGAGNAVKRTWTINVDPEGQISASEAEDTLEALDSTSPVNTVGDPQSETEYEGTAAGLLLDPQNGILAGAGSAAPTELSTEHPGVLTVHVPTQQDEPACANRPAEESGPERTGDEEEELAVTVGCTEVLPVASQPELIPLSALPANNTAGDEQHLTNNGASAIATDIAPSADLITRPLYDGLMTFVAIRDASAPLTYSWHIEKEDNQEMELANPKTLNVRWKNGPVAFSITAVPAHDAVGTTVPTHFSLGSENELTLTIEHRSSPYVYPVSAGSGWEGGFKTYEIYIPTPEGEAGEVSEGDIPEEGVYREATFGPPLPATGPVPLNAVKSKSKERVYKFSDCRFTSNGEVQEPPVGGSGGGNGIVRRAAVAKPCNNEADDGPYGGTVNVSWAVSMHGKYEYEPQGLSWINKRPDCDKWGPNQPAKLDCTPGAGAHNSPKLDLLGYFRFAPGRFGVHEGAGNPVCWRFNGVLPNRWVAQENGSPVLEVTHHSAYEWKKVNEPCTWNDLIKLD